VLPRCEALLCSADAGAGCDDSKVGLLFVTFVNDGVAVLANRGRWSAARQRFFFADGSRDTELLRRGLPAEVLEGARGTHPSGPDPLSPEGAVMNSFQTAYRARYGQAPPVFSETAFEAVYVAAAALELAGPGAGRPAVRDAVRRLNDPAGVPVTAGNWSQ